MLRPFVGLIWLQVVLTWSMVMKQDTDDKFLNKLNLTEKFILITVLIPQLNLVCIVRYYLVAIS